MILDGLDLNVLPLGADRAFDQSSLSHDIDFAIRRVRYGIGVDAGAAAGVAAWRLANVPVTGYLFERPGKTGEDPIEQADALLRSARALGLPSVVVDWERDIAKRNGRVIYDWGFPPASELQAIVDHLDAAGFPVMVYFSQGTPPGPLRHVTAYWIADYVAKPSIHADCWQWTSEPFDRSIWLGTRGTFRTIFGGSGPVVVPVPLPSAEVWEPMQNLVPMTAHRVVDLPIGTVFRDGPDPKAARYSVVGPDPNNVDATTREFGLLSAPLGPEASHWYMVANGDRGVYVRRTDVADVRVADKNVGA